LSRENGTLGVVDAALRGADRWLLGVEQQDQRDDHRGDSGE
jgi:hypothetical protein